MALMLLLFAGEIISVCEKNFQTDLGILTMHLFFSKLKVNNLEQIQVRMLQGENGPQVYVPLENATKIGNLFLGLEMMDVDSQKMPQMEDVKSLVGIEQALKQAFLVLDSECEEEENSYKIQIFLKQQKFEFIASVEITDVETVNSEVMIEILFQIPSQSKSSKTIGDILGDAMDTFYKPAKQLGYFIGDYYTTYILQVPLELQDETPYRFTLEEHFTPKPKEGFGNSLSFCTPDPDPRTLHGSVLPYLQTGKIWVFLDFEKLTGTDDIMGFKFELEIKEDKEAPDQMLDFGDLRDPSMYFAKVEKGFFFGLSGIEMDRSPLAIDEFKAGMWSADYLFDMGENLENFYKSNKGLVDTEVGGKIKGELDSQFLLMRAMSYNTKDLIDKLEIADTIDQYETQANLFPTLVEKNLKDMKKVDVLETIKKLMVVSGYQFFEDQAVIDKILQSNQPPESYLEFNELTELIDESETNFATGKRYIYSTHLTVDQLALNRDHLERTAFAVLLQLASSKIVIQKEALKSVYFGDVSEGFIIKISILLDEGKYNQFLKNANDIFGYDVDNDLDEQSQSSHKMQILGTLKHPNHISDESLLNIRESEDLDNSSIKHKQKIYSRDPMLQNHHTSGRTSQATVIHKSGSNHTHTSNETEIDPKVLEKQIIEAFPFETTMHDIEKMDHSERPVLLHHIWITNFIMNQFLQQSQEEFGIHDNDESFLFVTYLNSGKPSNYDLKKRKFHEIEEALKTALIHVEALFNFDFGGKTFKIVDQISYCIKIDQGVFYMVFQVPRIDVAMLPLNEFQFKTFMTTQQTPAQISKDPQYDAATRFIFSEFASADVMEHFLRMVEGYVFGQTNQLAPFNIVMPTHLEDGKFVYDKVKGTLKGNYFTHKQQRLLKENLADNIKTELRQGFTAIYYGEDEFIFDVKYTNLEIPIDPRDLDYQGFFDFAYMTLTRKWGKCPPEIELNFIGSTSTECHKVYGEKGLELSFQEPNSVTNLHDMEVTRSLRLHSYWDAPEYNQFVEDAGNEEELKIEKNGFDSDLHFMVKKSMSIDIKDLFFEDDGSLKEAKIVHELAVAKHKTMIDEVFDGEVVNNEEMATWLRAVSLTNNHYLLKDKLLKNYMKIPDQAETNAKKYSLIFKVFDLNKVTNKMTDFTTQAFPYPSKITLCLDTDGGQIKGDTDPDRMSNIKKFQAELENPKNLRYTQMLNYLETRQSFDIDVSTFTEVHPADLTMTFGARINFKLFARPKGRRMIL